MTVSRRFDKRLDELDEHHGFWTTFAKNYNPPEQFGRALMDIHFSLTAEDYEEYQRAYFASLAGFWQRNHFRILASFRTIVIIAGLNWIF